MIITHQKVTFELIGCIVIELLIKGKESINKIETSDIFRFLSSKKNY